MSDEVRIFVLSKGRVGKQKTLSYLPPNTIRDQVTFVVPESEVDEHRAQPYGKGLDILGVPDGLHLADKRMALVRWYLKQGGRYFMMADDDLSLSILDKDKGPTKFTSLKKYEHPEKAARYFSSHVPKMFQSYGMIGTASKFMAESYIREHGYYKFDHKCCCLFGYDAKQLMEVTPPEAVKELWGLDTTWNLLCLQAGVKGAVDYHMLWDSVFETAKSPGGANLYRNKENMQICFLRMLLLFPGLISRGREGLHHSSYLRIDWRNATQDLQQSKFRDKGLKAYLTEMDYQGLTDLKELLDRLPPSSRSFYRERAKDLVR